MIPIDAEEAFGSYALEWLDQRIDLAERTHELYAWLLSRHILPTFGTVPLSSIDTPHRVILRRQGQAGTWVPGSTVVQSGNSGSFSLNDNWTAGILLPSPLTVMTTNNTNFINLSGLSALSGPGPINIRVVGFILLDQATGQPVMVARSVEQLGS